MKRRCHVHDIPIHDGTICARCILHLERDLAETPALCDDLDVTLSRQTGNQPQDGGKNAETALPYNASASDVAANLHSTLAGWVLDLHGDGPEWAGPRCFWPCAHVTCKLIHDSRLPENVTRAFAGWLLGRLDRIRQHPAADQLRDEITYAVDEARRVVDRPKNRSRVFVAACLEVDCTGELYAYFPLEDYAAADVTTHARIVCTVCRVTFPAVEWMRVGTRVLRRAAS